jgi:galacturonokinase
MKRIVSPYRICPIGAHVDHQGGVMLARTIQLGTTLEYEPLDFSEMQISSDQFGDVKFSIGSLDLRHWSRYAQAAARVLKIKQGMRAFVTGSLIGSGLSSSASVGLAYLKALADVNNIELSDEQLVHLDFELEHDQLGLQNGLLDPMTIVYGRKDALLFIDPVTPFVEPIFDSPTSHAVWIVAYSGVSRELTNSGFNVRVAECHEAASLLQSGAWKLQDVPRERFEERKMTLPEHLRRRATHYFTEVERVQQGVRTWQESNLEFFGQLMNQSCESSITNYEVGNDILIELHELIGKTSGIYGSRFSGGGYGGCVVALAKRDLAEDARQQIAQNFKDLHPELDSKVFIVQTTDGMAASTPSLNPSIPDL